MATGQRPVDRPALHFKDVCKRDLKLADIDPGTWEQIADNRSAWRSAVRKGVRTGEDQRNRLLEGKRQRRKERQESLDSKQPSTYRCTTCYRDCHSRIGLVSPARSCSKQNWWPNTWCFILSDKIDGCLLLQIFPSRLVPVLVKWPTCLRVPKVTRESIEEMVEMVRENRSLYDPTCADHMDATMSNNIWHSIPQCPITCSMFPALFPETLCNTRRPIYSHH